MSGTLSVQNNKIKRKNPLKVNTITPRGYFGGQEVIDEQRKHFEPAELQRLFDAWQKDNVWYAYFFIQYFYGCRLSEPALILIEDVSFKTNQIMIRRLKKTGIESGFSQHVYFADPRVLACVKTALAWRVERKIDEENPFLFASPRHRKVAGAERLSQLRTVDGQQAISRFTAHRVFQKTTQQLKLPENLCHSHVLRHTRATLMLAAGASVEQVQFLLGHSSIKMTQRYIGIAESLRNKLNNDEELSKGLWV